MARGFSVPLVAALAGALLWAVLAILPPAPLGSEAPAQRFSASRAFPDIVAISQAPRTVGSAESHRTKLYLVDRLRSLGARVTEQPVPLREASLARLSRWSGRNEAGIVARNLIGVIAGRDPDKAALLLMAHRDSTWGSPGAADDAMGVAVALEVARALRSRGEAERDVILLFTDSEEIGLDGAEAFFARHPLARRVGVVINLEARGAGGRANMFETGPGNGAMMRLYADKVGRPATNSLSVLIYDLMPNSTDYTPAKARGIGGFNLATLDRAFAYHSPMATPAVVDRASLQDMGNQALELSMALALSRELPPGAPNAAFADLLGRTTIVYPATAGWAILLAAAGLVGAGLWRTRASFKSIVGGMIVTAALLLHGALLLTTFNAISGSGGANYYDRLAALPRLEIMAALLMVALLMLLGWFRGHQTRLIVLAPAMALMWAGLLTGGPLPVLVPLGLMAMLAAWFLPPPRRSAGDKHVPSALLMLFAAATVVQYLHPTAGPLLQWPLLLAAIGTAARAWLPAAAGTLITILAAAIGIGHLLAQAHFIFLGIGAELPAVIIVLLFAALPLILPLWPARLPRRLAGALLAIALALALWVRLDPIAPSIPVYSANEGGAKTKD